MWTAWRPVTGGRPGSPIAPDAYVEGDVQAPPVQPGASHSPIVEILAFAGRDAALIERLLTATSQILGDGLGMESGNVFAFWTELRPGRVSTGGVVRR